MKYCSLFSGIGGFDLALDRLGHECVYANDFDKYAGQIYNSRFNRQIDTRDIRLVKTDELPDFDLLVGGFPCQAFSIAGKRLGFEDTRGTLFFEIARIIKDKRPKYFLLENVKGLLNHNRGETFQTILATINELGYESEWQILNSKNHGVPQNRERIFISGYVRGEPRPKIFPFRHSNPEDIKTFQQSQISSTITTAHAHGTSFNMSYVAIPIAWSKSHRTGKSKADKKRKNYGKVEQRIKFNEFNTLNTGEGCRTQSSQNFVLSKNQKIRRLTEIECERLQGFPDNWTEGISSTQRYKCLGNAVTVNVIYDICKGYNEQH
jgi:DNA (cytosine-5)-methyltransferase 1